MRFSPNPGRTSNRGPKAAESAALVAVSAFALLTANPAAAQTPFFFSTGNPDGRIATASRPASPGKIEIESADDFILPTSTLLTSATFTGILTGGATVSNVGAVDVEIYRVFPVDSNTVRTPNVPTRSNSPSDVAFATRGTGAGLTFSTTSIASSFTASNSVLNGINPLPNQTTGGEGAVTGQEVQFTVNFLTPLGLPADHYFFIPQVQVTGGEFMWLSAPKPIVAPGTPFAPDLQSWVRNANLDPDWLRIGTDIVGGAPAPTYNAVFSLTGVSGPEPTAGLLIGAGLLPLGLLLRQRK